MSHRYYQHPHPYYAGVDLHARTLALHVCDPTGTTRLECELPAAPQPFLDAITPFRPGLVVGAECMFAWYWLADLCEDHHIPSSPREPPVRRVVPGQASTKCSPAHADQRAPSR